MSEYHHGTLDPERVEVVMRQVKDLFNAVDIQAESIKEIIKACILYRLRHPVPQHKKGYRKPSNRTLASSHGNIMGRLGQLDIELPEVPSLVHELNGLIADPSSSAQDIARVIQKSPSLTATLLKIVNSAFYGLRSKIDSIPRAVMLMGSKEVSHLAMGITIMETFRHIPKEVLDVASFLDHHLACGIVARELAIQSNISGKEHLFVSGMLHDIGRLVLCKYFPQETLLTFYLAEQSNVPLYTVEKRILGCNHTQIGKILLQKWGLPHALVDNIYYHHEPSSSPRPAMAAIVQIADMMVHGMGIGASAERGIPTFDESAWQQVNLPSDRFHTIIKRAEGPMGALRSFLSSS